MSTSTKNCIYCATPIADSALVCPNCKNYQSRWRNNLIFIGGLTGGAALIASAFAYIADHSIAAYKDLFWKDRLNIVELRTDTNRNFLAVISNIGFGDVYVLGIEISWHYGDTEFPINETVKKNELITVVHPDDHTEASAVNPGDFQGSPFEANRSGTPSAAVIKDLEREPTKEAPRCFLPFAFDAENAALDHIRNDYNKNGLRLVTEQAVGIIVFSSLHSQTKIRSSFPLVITFVRSLRDECKSVASENNLDAGADSH